MTTPASTCPIYQPWHNGLGDQWATINLLLKLAEVTGNKVFLSRLSNGQNLGELHDQIIPQLRAPTSLLLSSTEPGNTELDGFNVWATPFYPTRKVWDWKKKHGHYCYQFDGISAPDKNPSAAEQIKITDQILYQHHGLRLGKHYTVAQCVEYLAGASFFVGCDSGMSHIAHSVGVPVFLLQYGLPVVTCHRGKSYLLCEGADDFHAKLTRWLGYRKFLGVGP